MSKRIWTFNKSQTLYKLLVFYYGSYSDWGMSAYPSKSVTIRASYDKFCNDMDKLFDAKSGDAVKSQIAWAYTTEKEVIESYVETWYRNKAAAKEAGFIDNTLMPKLILCEY